MTKAKGRARAKERARAKAANPKKKAAKDEGGEPAARAGHGDPRANTMKNTAGADIRTASAMRRGAARSR